MKISGRRCYLKFSIGTLPKLHFIEAIRSAPHRDWLALIMPLWAAPGDPRSQQTDSIFRGAGETSVDENTFERSISHGSRVYSRES